MAAVQRDATGSLSTADIISLIKLLSDRGNLTETAGAATDASTELADVLRKRTNSVGSDSDLYSGIARALSPQIIGDKAADNETLTNRAAQISTAGNGGIDRAGAVAMSQGFAKALHRGMGDSTQAEDMATDMARRLSELYAKNNESAQQRAFDELMKGKENTSRNFNIATAGLHGLNKTALDSVTKLKDSADKVTADANKKVAENTSDLLNTKTTDTLITAGDKILSSVGGVSGGFDKLLAALKGGGKTTDNPAGSAADDGTTAGIQDLINGNQVDEDAQSLADNNYGIDEDAQSLADNSYTIDEDAQSLADNSYYSDGGTDTYEYDWGGYSDDSVADEYDWGDSWW